MIHKRVYCQLLRNFFGNFLCLFKIFLRWKLRKNWLKNLDFILQLIASFSGLIDGWDVFFLYLKGIKMGKNFSLRMVEIFLIFFWLTCRLCYEYFEKYFLKEFSIIPINIQFNDGNSWSNKHIKIFKYT